MRFQPGSIALLLLALPASADWHRPSAVPLFRPTAPIRWELRAPGLPRIEKEELGTLQVPGATLAVKLTPRGNARREFCESFPPFKIKLLKKEQAGTVFEGSDDSVHYVTHCRDPQSPEYVERLHLEYTVYRMLWESGLPASLARLTQARYVGASGEVEGPGMIPEHLKDTRRRLGVTDESPARPYDLVMAEIHLSLLFVQNADANIAMEHNVWALRNARDELVAYVAHDFDLTNLVDPEFFKNKAADWDDESRLSQIARSYGSDIVSGLLRGMHARRPGIDAAIAASPASAAGRARLTTRVESFFSAARHLGLL
ncbi:MAG: hypothetical protein HUU37_01535 [Bdellovibrionales bacterium]|nr:hypothetical protein [Bdellovibrionales bacterium]